MLWEQTDGQKFLKVHYKLHNVARLEVGYTVRCDSSKLCTKTKTLYQCSILLMDTQSQRKGI